jgi:glyoxylate reductase
MNHLLTCVEKVYQIEDDWQVEPPPMDSPLLELENCLIVPHLGSATKKTRDKMAILAVENLIAGLEDIKLPNCVNPEIYS